VASAPTRDLLLSGTTLAPLAGGRRV
jgi:hypothetical protein